MPCARDIKRRILSVKSTQQTTKAMKMVSAAKLYKVQKRVLAAKPYARALFQMFTKLAQDAQQGDTIPLLQTRRINRTLVILITGNRGLAGGFNHTLIRLAQSVSEENTYFAPLGKKGLEALRAKGYMLSTDFFQISDNIAPQEIEEIVAYILSAYASHQWDCVKLVYQAFLSAGKQEPVVQTILPLNPALFLKDDEQGEPLEQEEQLNEFAAEEDENDLPDPVNQEDAADAYEPPEQETAQQHTPQIPPEGPLFEGDKTQILEALSHSYVYSGILQAIMECKASEHIARMRAMSTATDNAGELIKKLQMDYNRSRQAAITRELSEISGCVHALT